MCARWILISLICCLPFAGQAQYAKFSVDTADVLKRHSRNTKLLDRVKEMRWEINGQALSFGSGTVKVKANPEKMDTLRFRVRATAEWDTILCNVRETGRYKFEYNECCGAFNLRSAKSRSFIPGKVQFELKGIPGEREFLGTLGEAGILLKGNEPTLLKPSCRSAMSPNVYWVIFREIQSCAPDEECTEGTCLVENDPLEPDYEFGFKTIHEKTRFLYMPLEGGPLYFKYDLDKDKISLR